MPLYEYECDDCGHRFERIQKFSDDLASSCPKCSGPVRKLVSSPAIQFKGTGWYITDYARKPSGGQAASQPSETSSKNESSSEKSSEKTSEKTSDSKPGSTSSSSSVTK